MKPVRKHLILLALSPLVLAGCGGTGSSSNAATSLSSVPATSQTSTSAETSLEPSAAFSALKSAALVLAKEKNMAFNYASREHADEESCFAAKFYIPATEASSSSSSSVAATPAKTIAIALDPGKGASKTSQAAFRLNGCDSVDGSSFLSNLYLDHPSVSITQETDITTETVLGINAYLDANTAYLDLSKANAVATALNTAVSKTEGNEDWSFPVCNDGYYRGKKALPSGFISNLVEYYFPLNEHFTKIAEVVPDLLKSDYEGKKLGTFLFEQSGSTMTLHLTVSSFSELYDFIYTSSKSIFTATVWASVVKPYLVDLKTFGQALTTFEMGLDVSFTANAIVSFGFDFNLVADPDKLVALWKENDGDVHDLSVFPVMLQGDGDLQVATGNDALIPSPSFPLASYPVIPDLKTTSDSSSTPSSSAN